MSPRAGRVGRSRARASVRERRRGALARGGVRLLLLSHRAPRGDPELGEAGVTVPLRSRPTRRGTAQASASFLLLITRNSPLPLSACGRVTRPLWLQPPPRSDTWRTSRCLMHIGMHELLPIPRLREAWRQGRGRRRPQRPRSSPSVPRMFLPPLYNQLGI